MGTWSIMDNKQNKHEEVTIMKHIQSHLLEPNNFHSFKINKFHSNLIM